MKLRELMQAAILFFPLLASQSASAATATGSSALALAFLVAEASPFSSPAEKQVMAYLFGGRLDNVPANEKISVKADSIVCRASNVDITSRSCELTFDSVKVNLTGREAHELYATIVESGVNPEGGAGSSFTSLSDVECTIDPHEIAQRAGGGADCTFDPGVAR